MTVPFWSWFILSKNLLCLDGDVGECRAPEPCVKSAPPPAAPASPNLAMPEENRSPRRLRRCGRGAGGGGGGRCEGFCSSSQDRKEPEPPPCSSLGEFSGVLLLPCAEKGKHVSDSIFHQDRQQWVEADGAAESQRERGRVFFLLCVSMSSGWDLTDQKQRPVKPG